ncbi:MAG: hypothetical protein AAF480_18380 [Actinomycetota bacterium]
MTGQILPTIGLFLLALVSVSLWTVRVAFTADRRLAAAAAVAAVEATTFAAAFSQLLGRIDSVASLAAYAIGVATGTVVALELERVVCARRAAGNHREQELVRS